MALRNRLDDRPVPVSYTAWRRWSDCPMAERLLREGAPRLSKQRRNFLVGDIMHEALDRTVRERAPLSAVEIANRFNHEASKPGTTFKDLNDRAGLQSKVIDLTEQLAPFVLGLVEAAEDYKTELELGALFPIDADDPKAGLFLMSAKMDLVLSWRDLTGADRWAIIDYKSGASDVRQMYWYSLVWHTAMPDCLPLDCYFIQPSADGLKKRLVRIPDTAHESALHDARTVARALMTKDLPAKPDTWKCKQCRVRPTCPDSAYSVQRGRLVYPDPPEEESP